MRLAGGGKALLKTLSAMMALVLAMWVSPVIAEDQGPPHPPGEFAQPYGDPLAPFNEKMFWFNLKLDHYVLHPVAKGYATVAPTPVRESVGRFFRQRRLHPALRRTTCSSYALRTRREKSDASVSTRRWASPDSSMSPMTGLG